MRIITDLPESIKAATVTLFPAESPVAAFSAWKFTPGESGVLNQSTPRESVKVGSDWGIQVAAENGSASCVYPIGQVSRFIEGQFVVDASAVYEGKRKTLDASRFLDARISSIALAKDIDPGSEYYQQLKEFIEKYKVARLYDDSTFRPRVEATAEQLLDWLAKSFEDTNKEISRPQKSGQFCFAALKPRAFTPPVEIPRNSYYYNTLVLFGSSVGDPAVLLGEGGQASFDRSKPVTRKLMAQILNRYYFLPLQKKRLRVDAKALVAAKGITLARLSDVSTSEPWYQDIELVSSILKVFERYPDGTFKPDKVMTREEAAVVLVQAMTSMRQTVESRSRECESGKIAAAGGTAPADFSAALLKAEETRLSNACAKLSNTTIGDYTLLGIANANEYANRIDRLLDGYRCKLVSKEDGYKVVDDANAWILYNLSVPFFPFGGQREQIYRAFGYVYKVDKDRYAPANAPPK